MMILISRHMFCIFHTWRNINHAVDGNIQNSLSMKQVRQEKMPRFSGVCPGPRPVIL